MTRERDAETGVFLPEEEFTPEELKGQIEECERRYGKVTRSLLMEDEDFASREAFDRTFGTLSKAKLAANIENPGNIHLTQDRLSELDDSITEKQEDVLIGLLMGDGCIECSNEKKNGLMQVGMINKPFLEWFDEFMGDITTGVRLSMTAEKSASNIRKNGLRPEAEKENYHDFYRVKTRRLPYFTELREWYSGGEKRFPDSLSLNPMITKMWYIGDGGLIMTQKHDFRGKVTIKSQNEKDRGDFLVSLFEEVGFSPYFDKENARLVFSNSESSNLLDWMGGPPRGFEYKWEQDCYETYSKLKKEVYS